jgi:hypothetical protein
MVHALPKIFMTRMNAWKSLSLPGVRCAPARADSHRSKDVSDGAGRLMLKLG